MKKIEKEIEHKYVVKRPMYVAEDGAEFSSEEECIVHEQDPWRKTAEMRDDIEINYCSLEPFSFFAPSDGDDTFLAAKPMTEEAAVILEKGYKDIYAPGNVFFPGGYTFVRLDQNDMVIDVMTEQNMVSSTKRFFDLMGYDVDFHKRVSE